MSNVGDGLAHPVVLMMLAYPKQRGRALSSFKYTAIFVSSMRSLAERT
jgi:hypothetical protein